MGLDTSRLIPIPTDPDELRQYWEQCLSLAEPYTEEEYLDLPLDYPHDPNKEKATLAYKCLHNGQWYTKSGRSE